MSAPQPHRPPAIRALNAAGRALAALGLTWPRLGVESALAAARRQTGLEDFGADSFRPGLAQLVESFQDEAQLTTMGRIMARGQLLSPLVSRLRVVDWRKRHPEVAGERIEQPLFVLGLPRTGTTLLYGLLAQDPAHRSPLTWEVADPCPPPEPATYASDPRIALAEKQFRGLAQLAPGFDAIHPMGARLPQECVSILAMDFASMQFEATFQVPSYQRWLDAADLTPAYRWHRSFLQHLQSRLRGERWVLKTPMHLMALDALFAVYPDALVVQTHRDPVEVIASVSSLHCVLRGATSDAIDPLAVGREQVERWTSLLERGIESRDRRPDLAPRFHDVLFPDLLARPFQVVEEIYARFGWKVSDAFRQRMEAFLAENAREKHGRHRYELAWFGLDRAETARRFAGYTRRFGIAPTRGD